MKFSDIIGETVLKKHIQQSVENNRIPHAQLFIGSEGSGMLAFAIAYAQYIICKNTNLENSNGVAACNLKFENLQHPDLHFIFPTNTNAAVKSKSSSDAHLSDWYTFIKENPYGSLNDWNQYIDIGNKQGIINVQDATNVIQKLALKSFEGGYKVMIIWLAEHMNVEASNKLLKLLEEPPQQTVFLLITENEKALLQTIISRSQVLRFNPLNDAEIADALVQRNHCDPEEAMLISKQAQGNYNRALKLLESNENDLPFEEWFITWVRAAFKANKDTRVLIDLIQWSDELSAIGRENQKRFLNYCMEMFRQALLVNYQVTDLVYLKPKSETFKLEKFAPFVNDKNITDIYKELSDAIYHVERNGNPKMIFTDLSIKLTRLIHRK